MTVDLWERYRVNPKKTARAQDIVDALDHMQDFTSTPLRKQDFKIKGPVDVSIDSLYQFDDIDAWAEWRPGDLTLMDPTERFNELDSFRGKEWAHRAVHWTPENIPAIVVVELPDGFSAIADGRGRVSYAIGMGWKKIPTIFLRPKK